MMPNKAEMATPMKPSDYIELFPGGGPSALTFGNRESDLRTRRGVLFSM